MTDTKNYNGFFESLTNPEAPKSTVREAVLAKAKAAVCGERDEQYGTPEDNFETIAEYWSLYLGCEIDALDVANMMILLKLARLGSGAPTLDSFVDIAGYAACGAEIADKENRPSLAFYRVTNEDERGIKEELCDS